MLFPHVLGCVCIQAVAKVTKGITFHAKLEVNEDYFYGLPRDRIVPKEEVVTPAVSMAQDFPRF